jgi:hypothetical protein
MEISKAVNIPETSNKSHSRVQTMLIQHFTTSKAIR